jgi:hypothetical protein
VDAGGGVAALPRRPGSGGTRESRRDG